MCYLLLLSWDILVSHLRAGCQRVVSPPRPERSHHHTPPCFVHRQKLALVAGRHCIPTLSPPTLKTLSWKPKYWQIFLCTWKYCHRSPWWSGGRPSPPLPHLPVRWGDGPSHPAPWGGGGSGLGQSGSSTFWQIKRNQRSWLRGELPTTAPMKLCGSISVWKYFNVQTLGGRVGYGKILLKNWNCSQKADT